MPWKSGPKTCAPPRQRLEQQGLDQRLQCTVRMSEPNSGITLPSMPAKAVEWLAIRTMSGPNAAAVTGAGLDRSLD